MIATCHTEGCHNSGAPIEVGNLTYTDDESGETITATVACGVCGQPIEDVVDNTAPEAATPDDGGPPE